MNHPPSAASSCHVLATDLDGTFIPLEGDDANRADLEQLAKELQGSQTTLAFVTGRHFESVVRAIQTVNLPQPDWIICDVGTSIYRGRQSGDFELVQGYQQLQDQITAGLPIDDLRDHCRSFMGLQLQEQEKQSRFKLSYYADAAARVAGGSNPTEARAIGLALLDYP